MVLWANSSIRPSSNSLSSVNSILRSPFSARKSMTNWRCNVASILVRITVSSISSLSFAACVLTDSSCSSTWYAGTSIFSNRAISSVAMDTLKSLMMSSFTIFLYFSKFSGLICFLISSSETPLLRMSVIIMANLSRAWLVTSVSGTSTSRTCANAADRAALRAGTNSLASSASTALRSSSSRLSLVNPDRTISANSSVTSGRVRLEASSTETSKTAFFPANVLSRSASGKVTDT
mmetsp:Transcript_14152/g.40334  ORF Transcript_14152/g.40334 Transcript_14152/m.40334 type:complete len:235 (-) Transcript_14152:1071-1775(-)